VEMAPSFAKTIIVGIISLTSYNDNMKYTIIGLPLLTSSFNGEN
jgi:hypothetical protein